MSLIATVVLAASANATGVVLPQCTWDKPGANPFMGDVVAAVDRYHDIPSNTRAKLKARMQARSYDDIAVIGRDAVKGKGDYAPEIRDMHFGAGSVCRTVTRTQWTSTMQERGLVYCEDGHCILVPTVCRNVSRITRLAAPRATGPAAGDIMTSAGPEAAPLDFDAPAAGPLAEALPGSFQPAAAAPMNSDPGVGGPGAGAGDGPGTNAPATFAGNSRGQLSPEKGLLLPTQFGKPTIVGGPDLLRDTVTAVPEPSTWALLVIGLLAVMYGARRKRIAAARHYADGVSGV